MNALLQHPPAVRTTCPYCGVGCGILASPDGQGGAAIAGDPLHPANKGRLCSKGAALGETLELGGRLLYPMVRNRDGALTRVPWSDALDRVANGFRSIAERDGSDAIAFYLSGQLLTEDYYVANKLMKGFMGSANVDTNSRLCMASSVAGHRRAFGSDTVPCHYEDMDEADLIILVGSNAAWCHPVLFQRMMRNKQDRKARIVVIDPRRTPTAESADLHLAILPGQDTTLFCGLLVHLAEALALDYAYIDTHCAGFENALVRAREIAPDVISTALSCGLQQDDVARLFNWFRDTPRSVTCYSQGVNQSAQGTDKVNAIINCHLATGRIGRLGMGPFSLTGQPNAMGGREVGGLANQLAAHMGFSSDEVDRVRRFWNAPRIATREGLKAVDMFEAIEAGTVKALWVMATNPAVSLPRANAMRDALRKLELLVVSENVRSNDTINAGAHVLLPAAAWGEKDGTVTNSERRISRQRAFLRPPGEARPDWWMVTEISRRLGFGEAFPYSNAADIFREHAALSGFENHGGRDFDIGDLAEISDETFDALEPVQWPRRKQAKSEQRFFTDGGFFTPDGKARFVTPAQPRLRTATSAEQPLLLNTGRIRDQWHTMTRTGQSPRLAGHIPEPFIEVHPIDATAFGLRDGGVARVSSAYGTCLLKVVISEGQRQGSVFAPIHWSDETASAARIGALLGPYVDPHSGQPEAKAIPVAIAPIEFLYRGFALVRSPVSWPSGTWWAQVALTGGVGILIATNESPAIWQARMAQIFNADRTQNEHAEYLDEQFGHYRFATFLNGRIESCFFIGTGDSCPPWDIVKSAFAQNPVSETQRRLVLSGRSGADVVQAGKLVCACFGVGLTIIRDAFETGLATNVEELGRVLNAGTNCGSCVPEIKRIMAHERLSATV